MSFRNPTRSELRRDIEIVDILITLVLIALAVISLVYYNTLRITIDYELRSYGLIGLFLIVMLMEIIPQILNPIFPMMIAMTFMNAHLAIILTIMASILGSFIGFEIGKKYGFRMIQALFEDQTLLKINEYVKKYGNAFVAVAAFTPLPYFPIVFGFFGMKRTDFWLFGIIPRVLFLLFSGYAISLGFVAIDL